MTFHRNGFDCKTNDDGERDQEGREPEGRWIHFSPGRLSPNNVGRRRGAPLTAPATETFPREVRRSAQVLTDGDVWPGEGRGGEPAARSHSRTEASSQPHAARERSGLKATQLTAEKAGNTFTTAPGMPRAKGGRRRQRWAGTRAILNDLQGVPASASWTNCARKLLKLYQL